MRIIIFMIDTPFSNYFYQAGYCDTHSSDWICYEDIYPLQKCEIIAYIIDGKIIKWRTVQDNEKLSLEEIDKCYNKDPQRIRD